MSDMHGTFGWIEYMADDVASAANFYAALLGFEIKDAGGGMDYNILHKGDVGYGGMMKIPAPAKAGGMTPCWLGYVMVDDIDASLKALQAAGGRSYMPITDVP